MHKLKRKAFTIIEMVIVIAVIATLAAVMIPTISGVIQKANHSADTQFVASLNIQLAMTSVDREIKNESDLKAVIDEFYGEGFYDELAPKSAKQGYHYWYDIENGQVILETVDALVDSDDGFVKGFGEGYVLLSSDPATVLSRGRNHGFSPASLRCNLIPGYYLIGSKGNDLIDLISTFETLDGPQAYEDAIKKLEEMAKVEEGKNPTPMQKVAAALRDKVEKTTIITDRGAFRHDADSVEYVYVSQQATYLLNTKTYVYNGTEVGDTPSDIMANENFDGVIELPSGVKVGPGGLPAIKTDNYGEDELHRDYSKTTHLYVNESDIKDLENIFSDCVLVLPNGSRYLYVDGEIYTLPLEIDEETKMPTSPSVGSVNTEMMGNIDKFSINCGEATTVLNTGKIYLYNGTLYMAYDQGSLKLSLTDGITSSMVNWTSDNEDLIKVDGTGKVTIQKLPGTTADTDYDAKITATYKYDETKKAEINVYVVRPKTVNVTITGMEPNVLWVPNTNTGATLTYDGIVTEFPISTPAVGYNQDGYVITEDCEIVYSTNGNLFSIENNKLKLDAEALNGKSGDALKQNLTITYTGKESGTEYLTYTYEVTVVDNSATPYEVNKITDSVKMGETYLFRVGNDNPFALGKLFNTEKAPSNLTLKIYDASKSLGEGKWGEIATSGGFSATYTSNLTKDNWESSTIKFSGTGVAIIEITTNSGTAKLAVEVVNGKNVTSASDFSGATNYVLLNDVAWGTTKDVEIKGSIYGNGFAINAKQYLVTVSGNTAMFKLSGGTIDNLVINGPVYPELSYSSETYYIAGIYATGDATISNSYISGFREPIMANGYSLTLENTTLVGGNYANLWLQTGTLTLNNVTTVQAGTVPTIGSSTQKVLGMGVVANSGVSASNVTIAGDLNQYNWVSESDANNMDSDIKSLVSTIFKNSTLFHSVNGTKYINTGILFLGNQGTVNNASQTNKSNYEALEVSGSFMGVSVSANAYTHTSTNGVIDSVPTYGGYVSEAQSILKPVFIYTPSLGKKPADLTTSKAYNYLENGVVYIGIDTSKNETFGLNISAYTLTKYTGQTLTPTITCDGGTKNGDIITFNRKGEYTITYSVTDNTFYNLDGSVNSNPITYTYKVKVVVSNTNIPSAVIDVSGVDKTIYMGLEGKKTDSDYAAFFAILKGLKITDYDEDGKSYSVTVPTNSKPAGLTVTVSNSEFTKEYTKDNVLYLGDSKANNNNDYSSITVTYKYTGTNKVTVSATVTYTDFSNYEQLYDERTSTCVTADTLVMLADGTQKEIQYVTYEDQLLVWNFYTGEYDVMPASIVMNHGYGHYTVVSLNFSDGTTVNTINGHGFFDVAERKYVILDDSNAMDYIGHQFVKVNGNGYSTVTLESFSVDEKYTESWSILTAAYYNCILENMWTLTPAEVEGSPDYLMPFEVGEGMKYDEKKMYEDIAKYGQYTYEDFAEYCTYEQFIGFGFANWKIAVEKGYITWDEIVFLLQLHLG